MKPKIWFREYYRIYTYSLLRAQNQKTSKCPIQGIKTGFYPSNPTVSHGFILIKSYLRLMETTQITA